MEVSALAGEWPKLPESNRPTVAPHYFPRWNRKCDKELRETAMSRLEFKLRGVFGKTALNEKGKGREIKQMK